MKYILKVKNKNNFDLAVGSISSHYFIKVQSLLNEEQTDELIEEFPDIMVVGRGNIGPNEIVEFETEVAAKAFKKAFETKYKEVKTKIEEIKK